VATPTANPATAAGYRAFSWKTAFTFTVGLGFVAATLLQLEPLNGPWYWKWAWRDLGLLRTALCLSTGLIPLTYALIRTEEPSWGERPWKPIALFTLANLLFQAGSILAEAQSFRFLKLVIASPTATSYYQDAGGITGLGSWLASYPSLELGLHSSTHPPGPIVFCWIFRSVFGDHYGAYAAGIAIALLSSLGVAVSYRFSALWTTDRRSRLAVPALYAMVPGFIVFYPEFDQVYAVVSMLLILSWAGAIEGKGEYWILTGFLLFLATFFTYSLLTLGSFLLYLGLRAARLGRENGGAIPVVAKAAGFSLLSCVLFYLALYVTTGFNPLLTFERSLTNQKRFAELLNRPYGTCVVFDLYDFFLAAGILALPLLLSFLKHGGSDRDLRSKEDFRLAMAGVITVVIVDVSGLLRAETARVWLFLQPLVLVPVARELAGHRLVPRSILMALQWLILVVLKARMTFVQP
jgi:hypothetical protein